MTLVILVFLGGVLSVLSPCVLPIIPFVFARGDRPFRQTGLPLLAGMAITFAVVATLASVAGGWAVATNEYGRIAAILILALFAIALLSERVSRALSHPLIRLGNRLRVSPEACERRSGLASSVLLGVATGLLWAPCAGPILGLVLTTAALNGASAATSLLLLAYAAGTAVTLAIVLRIGNGALRFLKQNLGVGVWVRRGLGVAVLGGVVAVATGADGDLLSPVPFADTAPIEQWLINHAAVKPSQSAARTDSSVAAPEARDSFTRADGRGPSWRASLLPVSFSQRASAERASANIEHADVASASSALPIEGRLPSLGGAIEWLNSPPLSVGALRGKVALINFWTYACINCRHILPHVKAWAEKYRNSGLIVIGVHTPELAFEKVTSNVKNAVRSYGITYPVAIDLNYKMWKAFNNQYWPANYFADAQGRVRYHHFGEGDYRNQERVIQQLLIESGATNVPGGYVSADAAPATASSPVFASNHE